VTGAERALQLSGSLTLDASKLAERVADLMLGSELADRLAELVLAGLDERGVGICRHPGASSDAADDDRLGPFVPDMPRKVPPQYGEHEATNRHSYEK
jgi:hypothetical protein